MKAYLTIEEHDQMDEVYYYYHFYTDNSEIDIDFAVGIHDNNYNTIMDAIRLIIEKYGNFIEVEDIGKNLRIHHIDAPINIICEIYCELTRIARDARKAYDATIDVYLGGTKANAGTFTIYAYSKEEALEELERAVEDTAKLVTETIGTIKEIKRGENTVEALIEENGRNVARVEGYFLD